jgi:hypothetical protein
MRIFVRALWMALMTSALAQANVSAAEEPPFRPESITGTVRHSPGAAHVTLRDGTDAPFARPVLRLVALPPGAREPRLELPHGMPAPVEVTVGDLMILRGVPVAPVRISPASSRLRSEKVPRAIELDVRYREGLASRASTAAANHGRGFFAPYESFLLRDSGDTSGGSDEGAFLIVTAPEFVSGLGPLVAWKREMGFEVRVVTTDEAGTTNEDIRDHVENIYQSAPSPPQYLLLVGDVEQIPGYDYHQSVSDLPYSLLDGDDFLPDLELGRLSVQTVHDLETVVAKILCYEQDPNRAGDDAWFSRALMVGGNVGSATPVPVSRWCREQILDPAVGYTEVDTTYGPTIPPVGYWTMLPIISEGLSLISYRGWAYGWQGWEEPRFTVDHVPALTNGWMLPAVFSFVCLNGDFTEPECFGEAWIRAGTATEPKGGVAFLGNSENWSHTRYNDAAAIGAFDGIRANGIRRLGQILNASRAKIFEQFPDMVYYDPFTDESVEFYYYIYSLLGDPSMELRTAAPTPIQVVHADSIAQGSTLLEVTVLAEDGVTPVSDARVGVCQGETVLGSTRTDSSGLAGILASFEDTVDPVKITVTGTNLAPYRDSLVVYAGDPFLALEGFTVDDDSSGASLGNDDGLANPGETLELTVTVRNRGASGVTGVSGSLEALGGAAVQVGGVAFPDISAGATAASSAPFVVAIDEDAEDELVARFRLQISAGGDTSGAGFDLPVRAPDFRYESHSIGGDGVLDPGDSATLTLTVLNEGSIPATTSQAVLRSATPTLATVVDSSATFGPVAAGLTVTQAAPFTVAVSESAGVGQAAVWTLTFTTEEGYRSETGFSIVLGTVDHRAPLGPDAYGYYAYDNSDSDYPDAVPVYEWVTTSPTYGGSGTPLGLDDNTTIVIGLPFPFTFYGQSYDSLLVSDNGWASFEIAPYFDFYNWRMPNSYGVGAQLAPFWDNLDPNKEYQGQPVGDGVYSFHDAANHRLIVEWSRLGNKRSQHEEEARPDYDDLQTFQLILHDPVHHPTPTGDGIVRFQYKQIVNNDNERMYSTVGIEDETESVGLEYTYANLYPPAAAPLSAGLAIDFTTRVPRYDPFRLVRFTASRAESGVQLAWEPCDDRPRNGYRVYRATPSGVHRLVEGGSLGPEARSFLDGEADPGAAHSYKIGSLDPVGSEALFGPFAYTADGSSMPALSLGIEGPNPTTSGPVRLRYSIPTRGEAWLRIYSVTGRLVRTLVGTEVEAGVWTVGWDGRDDGGREVASGVYFGRLEAGSESRRTKITLIR